MKTYALFRAVVLIVLLSCLSKVIYSQGLEGLIIERYYITDANDQANAIAQGAVSPLPIGSVAYRVYVDMAPGYKFSQLFGNTEHNLTVTTTTSFFNDPNYGVAVNPATISVNNSRKHTALIDSWFTTGGAAATKTGVIEVEDTDGTIGNLQNILANNPGGCYGLPINGTDAQDGLVPSSVSTYVVPNTLGLGNALDPLDQTNGNSITINNGAIAALGGVVGPTTSNIVLIAQFTTDGILSFNFNLQLVNISNNQAENYVTFNPGPGELSHPSLAFISGNAPTISMTAPLNNTTVELGATVNLQATASDNGGVVNSVEFYVDGGLLGTDTEEPFDFDYTATNGSHSIYAIAYDNDCLTTTSAAITINVVSNIAPTISLNGPTAAVEGESLIYTALANDTDGTIAQVEFFIGGVSVGVDNTSPFILNWIAQAGLNQLVTAIATDNIGSSTTSNIVVLNVAINEAPQISLTSPSSVQGYVAPENITVAANALDLDGTIAEVEFFVNGNSLGIDNSFPFEVNWMSEPGSADFYAVATDNLGLTSVSETVTILVVDPNALPYYIGSLSINCDQSIACLPIGVSSTLPISNVIGLDIAIAYDENKLLPTGNYSLTNNLANSADVEVALSIPNAGELILSIFFINGNAGMNEFSGVGELMCIEFERLGGFLPEDITMIEYTSIQESYISGVQPSVGTSGEILSTVNTIATGNLVFWTNGEPIGYDLNNPNENLITSIFSAENGMVNDLAPVELPNVVGEFEVDFSLGNEIKIERDVNNLDAIQLLVNAADIALTKTVALDGNFVPSIFEIIAMDVNLDGVVSAGDISQMKWRAVSAIGEYMQTWNYDNQGVSNGEPSLDWVFVPNSLLSNSPEYSISSLFPMDDQMGYSRNRVPAALFSIPLEISNFSPDNSTCAQSTPDTYTGVLLGDVNGNYDGSSEGLEVDDMLVFDLSQVEYTTIADERFIEFPIMLSNPSTNVYGIDFWMNINTTALEFVEVMALPSNVDVEAYFNELDGVLRVTASTSSLEDFISENSDAFFIKFKWIDPCQLVSQEMFSNVQTLVNGIHANSMFEIGTDQNEIEISASNSCAEDLVTISFNEQISGQSITSFDWDLGNGNSGSSASEETTYESEGTYSIVLEITTDAGCSFNFQNTINVLPLPQVSFTSVLDIASLEAAFTNQTFIVNSSIATYEWNFGDQSTSDQISPVHTYAEQGIYEVILTATSEDGCSASFTNQIELISGIQEWVENEIFNIYPNPSSDFINVRANVNSQVWILDESGKIVKEMFMLFANSSMQINIRDLSVGVYTIHFVSDEKTSSMRFVRN